MAAAKGWLYKSPRFRADIRVRRCGHTRAHANSGPSPKICTPSACAWESICGSYSYHHHKTRFFINHLNQAFPTNVGLSFSLSFFHFNGALLSNNFSFIRAPFWACEYTKSMSSRRRTRIHQDLSSTRCGPHSIFSFKMAHENGFLNTNLDFTKYMGFQTQDKSKTY